MKKLVCESIQEYRTEISEINSQIDENYIEENEQTEEIDQLDEAEELDEDLKSVFLGPRGLLKAYIKDPSKKDYLTQAFAYFLNKYPKQKDVLLKMNDNVKLNIAKQALSKLEANGKAEYPIFKVENDKVQVGIVGGGGGATNVTTGA